MDFYAVSTQAKHWTFQQSELAEKRIAANELAKKRVKKAWEKEQELSGTETNVQLISSDEQCQLISFYGTKIISYCKVFKFDKNIEGSAICLFKRFFLEASVMEYDPPQILITCLFLSSKIEHQPISLTDFLNKIPKSPIKESQMLDLEVYFVLTS
jgi:cyclin H